MKTFLKYLFCPLLIFYNSNINEKVVGIKSTVVKIIFLVFVVGIVVFLFYAKEIFNL